MQTAGELHLTHDMAGGLSDARRLFVDALILRSTGRVAVAEDLDSATQATKQGRRERFIQVAKSITENVKTAFKVGTASIELREPVEYLIKVITS